MNIFKKILIGTPIIKDIFEYLNRVRLTGTLHVSLLTPENKANLILNYAKRYNCRVFVETGTYRGETLNACKDFFDDLYSIELRHELFVAAKNRFSNIPKIHIFEGDSGEILPQIIKGMDKPILFWLDAHHSGVETARGKEGSPIIKELTFILNNRSNDCILIDDAKDFKGKDGYPTIGDLKKIIEARNKARGIKLNLLVKNNIIRISQ